MLKKYKGIIISTKIYKENDLLIKFLSNTDEIITGIVYGGLSKKKRSIYQIGFFLNFNIVLNTNRPPSINAELSEPFISLISDNKYKLNCLLSTISLINLSIIEGQKIKKIFKVSEDFLTIMINKKRWIIHYFLFLFNLLKIIGYEIDFNKQINNKYFDLETQEFTENKISKSVLFPYDLLKNNNYSNLHFNSINNIFIIFESIFINNHLSDINLQLPNQYLLFKKLILDNFNKK